MARRRVAEKREPLPDPKFRDTLVTKFINVLMLCGKKSTAEQIFYGALDLVAERSKQDPLSVFKRAMDNVKPVLEVKSRRVGGSTYQVPVEVRPDRRQALSARWIVQSLSRAIRNWRTRLVRRSSVDETRSGRDGHVVDRRRHSDLSRRSQRNSSNTLRSRID